jgi:hypothetical protein
LSSIVRQEGTACEDEHQVEGNVEVGLGFEIEGCATYEIKSGVDMNMNLKLKMVLNVK